MIRWNLSLNEKDSVINELSLNEKDQVDSSFNHEIELNVLADKEGGLIAVTREVESAVRVMEVNAFIDF